MSSIASIVLEVPEPELSRTFVAALGVTDTITVRPSGAEGEGFRGFTVSLLVSQPGNVEALVRAALDAGAEPLKPVSRSLWGYGGVLRSPDGTIWKVATSKKRDSAPVARAVDDVVLLLGSDDVPASRKFYVDRGLSVKRSFGSRYVEFDGSGNRPKLALYGRRALAKDAGVDPTGGGSHRLVLRGDVGAFTDPDGFVWEPAA